VRAEDARVVAIHRERDEAEAARLNAEKEKAEAARIRAQEESQLRAQADANRMAADAAKRDALAAADTANAAAAAANRERVAAENAKAAADAAKLEANQAQQSAEQARNAALAQQQQLAMEADKARLAAADADRLRQDAEQRAEQQRQSAEQLKQQLLLQFNQILQTRETARGLIVNMSDVLFDTAQYTLKPGAREKLAKVSGIILAHPGLKIAVEGHTDSVGGDDYNMTLSENRANAVRSYLVSQGVSGDVVTAKGFGKTLPVADNGTAAGRQANRRVELVVSGDILGTSISDARSSQ